MSGLVIQKDWGWSEMLHESGVHQASRIDVREGGFCSVHLHRQKWNGFTVVRGRMLIEVWRPGEMGHPIPDTAVLLSPGDYYSVAPGVLHRFVCDVATCAIETYWPGPRVGDQVNEDDIVRFSSGGIRKW